MNAFDQTLSAPDVGTGRSVVFRTRGQAHGPFVRLATPSDVGQIIKPFVALDLVDTQKAIGRPDGGWHPHSGIGTLTLSMEGRGHYAESTGNAGTMEAGDIEWMSAGRGVWHSGFVEPPIKGFQLWVALPAGRELTPAFSQHLSVNAIPSDGPARVLLGRSGKVVSPMSAPSDVNLVDVQLKAGQRWTYQPPQGFRVGWIAVMHGSLRIPDLIVSGELAVFDDSDRAVEVEATSDARFILGAAIPHPYDLHLGYYSVHTSSAALSEGEGEIERIGRELRTKGVLR